MTLKLRGQIQIQDASIELSKIKDISSGKLIGRPEETSSNYDAENATPAELSGEDIRRIAELHIDDNVHFANLESDAINAASATLAGSLSAASADLNDGALLAGTATLSGDLIASGSATAASAAFSGTLDAGASTLASATISNTFTSGSMSSTGTLSSAGKATLNSLEVTNDTDILGDAVITGSLSAASAGFGSGTLNAGASTLASANIAGAASAGSMSSTGTLSSAGKATLNSLEVTNDADILGATAVTGSLSAASANFSSESGGGWNDPVKYDTDLTASDPASLDFFGSGVGLSSNGLVLAVGACRWEGPVNDQGGVYIYDWDSENDVWNQKGSVITADPAQDSARFGETTSLNSDGTMLAVGSQMWDGTVTDQGAAYVFERTDADSTDWTQKGSIITHSNPSQTDLHTHVSLSDDGLVLSVGVYCSDVSGDANSGAVYVYDWDTSSNDWVERTYGGNIITNADLSSGDLTGWDKLSFANSTVDYQVYDGEGTIRLIPANSTSTEGTWAAVGSDVSYNFVDGQTYQLKFDVKHYTNEDRNIVYGVAKLAPGGGYNGWVEVVNMDVHAAVPGESTSGEISLSWTATSETTNGIHIRIHHGGDPLGASGAVYVNNFRITDEDGTLITNSDAGIGSLTDSTSSDTVNHYFGRDTSLSSDGSVLVVGAAGWDDDTSNQGAVFTYNWNAQTNQWDQVGDVLEASSPSVNDYFGFSCQINSDATILVVSKYQYVDSGGDIGEIEIYDWNSSTSSWDFRFRIENPYSSNSGTKNVTAFGYKVSIDGDGDVLVISERGTGNDTFAGRVQTYSISQSSSGGDLEAGAATLASASISGDISAANATFSADLSAASANFGVGTLSAGASTLASLTAGTVSAGSLASSSVNIDGGYIDATAIGESSRSSGKFSVVDITGSMTVGGDLTVSGDTTTIDTTNLIIKDSMIQMGEGNSTDTLDLGFIGQYDSNNYAGLVRDADDSGVFKLFYTDEDLSSSQTVDFDSATKATLKADIKGDIEYATSKNWSISGDIVAPNVSYDGTENVVLNATIQADSVEFSMLECKIDENDMASDSSSHIPTQSSVKAYVDTQVAAAGLNNPEPTVFLIVDSTTTFVGAKQVKESMAIDTSNVNNDYNYIDLTVAADDQFDELSQVFLNGKKLRFSHDESTREYYFSNDDSSEYKRVHIKSEIIENGDIVEAVYFVRTSETTYTLTATPNTIEEGNSFTVTLDTTNVANGTQVSYSISGGLIEEDYTIGPAGAAADGGYFEISDNTASFTMDVISDALHGGDETVTIDLDNGLATLDIVIQNNPNND